MEKRMRGIKDSQFELFGTISLNSLIPAAHPLRAIKKLADDELARLSPRFDAAYSKVGRPSIPPEALIKALLIQALYSIPSETRLCEEIGFNFLFRWFCDLKPGASVWDPTTFTQNRNRFAEHGFVQAFFDGIVAKGIATDAASTEHFSVDGTLIQSLASLKSLARKDEDPKDPPSGDSNGWADFAGEKRSNETHISRTDPEAKLARKSKGQAALLSHSMHVLMENRNALLMDIEVSEASGTAEREASVSMLKRIKHRHWFLPDTVGEDKGYDAGEHLLELEALGVTPHVAIRDGKIASHTPQADARRRARDRQGSLGYKLSIAARRGIEKTFAWLKERAELKRSRFFERWKTKLYALVAGAAYNLIRLSKLLKQEPKAAPNTA
jgi:transposase